MPKRLTAFYSLVSILLCACTPARTDWPSSRFYIEEPAGRRGVANSVLLTDRWEQVWNRLAARLEKVGPLQRVEDAAMGRFKLTISNDRPEEWIDCGQATRSYTRRGEVEHYQYRVVQSATYKAATRWRSAPQNSNGQRGWLPRLELIDRRTAVKAHTLILVNALDAAVRVDVYVHYGLVVEFHGRYRNEDGAGGVVAAGPLRPRSIRHGFTTNEHNTYSENGFPARCHSTGRLERELLAAALPHETDSQDAAQEPP